MYSIDVVYLMDSLCVMDPRVMALLMHSEKLLLTSLVKKQRKGEKRRTEGIIARGLEGGREKWRSGNALRMWHRGAVHCVQKALQ